MKLKITLCALLLLFLSLGFNIMLTISSMEKVFTEALVSEYTVIAGDLQRAIDRSLRFGKDLEKFTGMDRVLSATREQIFKNVVVRHTPPGFKRKLLLEEEIVISVAAPDGRILHTTRDELRGETYPREIRELFAPADGKQAPDFVEYDHALALALPIHGKGGAAEGYTVISFSQAQVDGLLAPYFEQNFITSGVVMVCGMALVILSVTLLSHGAQAAGGLPWRRLSLFLFLIVGIAQIVFSGLNLRAFRHEFLTINKAKADTLMSLLQEDIEFFFKKGLTLDKLSRMDKLLGPIMSASPELANIVIYDEDGQPFYLASHEGDHDYRTGPGPEVGPLLAPGANPLFRSHFPLMRGGEVHGHVVAHVSRDVLFDKVFEIFKDSATVLFISILFFVEMLILANLFIKDQVVKQNGANAPPPRGRGAASVGPAAPDTGGPETDALATEGVPLSAIRPAAFLFLFGIDLCISFLPLYMKELYVPIAGLSKEVILGLPISVEMFFVGLAILVSGGWSDRRGWHEPLWLGLAAAMAGTAYSWLAPNAAHFIAARGLVGIGYGAFLLAAQGFVAKQAGPKAKVQGMAQLWAGVFAGSICGGAAGAMVAERIGYRPVLMVGLVILVFAGAYAAVFLRRAMGKPTYCLLDEHSVPTGRLTVRKAFRFLFDRDVFGLVAFASIPGSLAFVGFMYYFSPVYLQSIGESQSDIGRIYMLYGVCLIYVAPYISKFLDRVDDQKFYIFLSGILGCLGFTTYYFFGGIPATALTALLLGVSGSLDVSRAYVLKLKVTHDMGDGAAMSLFNSVGRVGQVLGPMLFGWMLVAFGMPQALTTFGILYLGTTVAFTLCTRSEHQLATKGLLAPDQDKN